LGTEPGRESEREVDGRERVWREVDKAGAAASGDVIGEVDIATNQELVCSESFNNIQAAGAHNL